MARPMLSGEVLYRADEANRYRYWLYGFRREYWIEPQNPIKKIVEQFLVEQEVKLLEELSDRARRPEDYSPGKTDGALVPG